MGYDAEVWLFDDAAYRTVAPAWKRSAEAGRLLPELRALMGARGLPTRRLEQPEQGESWWQIQRGICRQPDLLPCTMLSARAICAVQGQFLGRSRSPNDFIDFLCAHYAIGLDHPLADLLHALDVRATLARCDNCCWQEGNGITGWLDPAETARLAHLLDRLDDLPRYKPSFAAMHAAWEEAQRWDWAGDQGETSRLRWRLLSLSFLRTTAQIAAAQGQSVLWGNDFDPAACFA